MKTDDTPQPRQEVPTGLQIAGIVLERISATGWAW
jgi:hypothetical protein